LDSLDFPFFVITVIFSNATFYFDVEKGFMMLREKLAKVTILFLLCTLFSIACANEPSYKEDCDTDKSCPSGFVCKTGKCERHTSQSSEITHKKQYLNGERLKARILEGSDGSKQFLGWWDSKLKHTCNWTTPKAVTLGVIPSENYYCANVKTYTVPWNSSRYFDSNCTDFIFEIKCPTQDSKKKYAFLIGKSLNPVCSSRVNKTECFVLEDKSLLPNEIYQKNGDGECKKYARWESLKESYKKEGVFLFRKKEKCTENNMFGSFVKAKVVIGN
jgi:hypothetical protein